MKKALWIVILTAPLLVGAFVLNSPDMPSSQETVSQAPVSQAPVAQTPASQEQEDALSCCEKKLAATESKEDCCKGKKDTL